MAKKKAAVKKTTTKKKQPTSELAQASETPLSVFERLTDDIHVPATCDDAIAMLVRSLRTMRTVSSELQDILPFVGARGLSLKIEKNIFEASAAIRVGVDELTAASSGYLAETHAKTRSGGDEDGY